MMAATRFPCLHDTWKRKALPVPFYQIAKRTSKDLVNQKKFDIVLTMLRDREDSSTDWLGAALVGFACFFVLHAACGSGLLVGARLEGWVRLFGLSCFAPRRVF